MSEIRVSFSKDFWPFVSGDQAIVKRRVADWLVQAGYAVRIQEHPHFGLDPVPFEAKEEQVYKPKLTTRVKRVKK